MLPECLVVDDSRIVRAVVRERLAQWNILVREAEDGLAALSECQLKMPQMILMDWYMPGLSGPETIERLRILEGAKKIKIVLSSTESRLSHIRMAMRSGADHYLVKPFKSDGLERILQRFCMISE